MEEDDLLSNLSFFERAEKTAEWNVREWIRKTLREVFLRAFQRQQQLLPEDKTTIIFDQLEPCLHLVERVSRAWQSELQKQKHFRVAKWVQHVWDMGRENLWSVELTAERWKNMMTKNREDNHHHGHDNDGSYDVVVDDDDVDDVVDQSMPTANTETVHEIDVNQPADETTQERLLQVPFCELRKIGRVTHCDVVPHDTDYLSKLKRMGKEGQSYWPLDHHLVDDLAKTIPKRQRWERRSPASKQKFQVVLQKSSGPPHPETSDNEDDDDDDKESSNQEENSTVDATSARIFAAVLQKSSSKIKAPKLNSSKRKKTRRQMNVLRNEEVPRPPSAISSTTYNVHEELTTPEKEELDRTMIHPDENEMETNSISMACIFGELQNIGTIHAQKQEEKKGNQGMALADLTERQRRRQERAYIKERLAPRRIQKNQDPQNYRSKVLRTEQVCEDGTTKTFLEFDMGWSLVEYEIEGEKRLLVFSSVEATLEEPQGSKGPTLNDIHDDLSSGLNNND